MNNLIVKFFVMLFPYCAWMSAVFAQKEIPPVGTVFNEAVWTADSVTGRKLLRLTQFRDFNQTPTYHINTCFSSDSKSMVFASWNKNGASALLSGNMETGDITVIAVAQAGEKAHFNGNNICMIPATGKAAAVRGGKVYLYDLSTLEEKCLLTAEEGYGFGHPAGSVDGKTIFVTKMPQYNREKDDPWPAALAIYYSIDLETGKVKEFFRDSSRSNHTVACPSNPDLLLIDRDLPPKYGHGGDDGKTSRVWLLNISTQKLTEIRPQNSHRFQIHSNWSFDGKHVYYHGVSHDNPFPEVMKAKPHFIGVADLSGKIVWEKVFPNFTYGHISSHSAKNAIITDGLIFRNMITEILWEETDLQNFPVINILGAHNSGPHTLGQYAHPHCIMSPDSRYLSYNRGYTNRSDVFILNVR